MQEFSRKSDFRQSLVSYAAKILVARPYFRAKLRDKLFLRAEKFNFLDPSGVIDSILDDLSKSGYLNDKYLAEAFVRRQLSKGYGPKIISLKLKFLGLDREIISEVLKSQAYEELEVDSISRYCRKYPRVDPRKLISKLYQRGYNSQAIKKVFDSDWLED